MRRNRGALGGSGKSALLNNGHAGSDAAVQVASAAAFATGAGLVRSGELIARSCWSRRQIEPISEDASVGWVQPVLEGASAG